jgi:hypothetical protein
VLIAMAFGTANAWATPPANDPVSPSTSRLLRELQVGQDEMLQSEQNHQTPTQQQQQHHRTHRPPAARGGGPRPPSLQCPGGGRCAAPDLSPQAPQRDWNVDPRANPPRRRMNESGPGPEAMAPDPSNSGGAP